MTSLFLSGLAGFFVDVGFFGMYEMAVKGAIIGGPSGFLIAVGIGWYLIRKGKEAGSVYWQAVAYSVIGASIIVFLYSNSLPFYRVL